MTAFDKLALLVLFGALALWVVRPVTTTTGVALAVAGVLHVVRLARWCGDRSLPEPLLLVLHVGYALLPLGALAMAVELLVPGQLAMAAAQHVWMTGTIGLMTLAVMTRATLGHTDKDLTAGAGTTAVYLALVMAMVARLAAGFLPGEASFLHVLSGLAWIGAFGGFAVLYGPLLVRPKPEA